MLLEVVADNDECMIINIDAFENIRLIDSVVLIHINGNTYRIFFDTAILAKDCFATIRNNIINNSQILYKKCKEFDIF